MTPVPVVVDASVGIKWYIPEVHSAEAVQLLDVAFERHVPAHFFAEIANTVWKKVALRHELTADEGRDVRIQVERVPVQSHPTAALLDPAFEIALATRRTIYDCVYVALAEILGCKAVTADARLYNALQGGPYGAWVHWIEHPL